MKNFETIRKLSNLGRILSKIVFICSIIGICVVALCMVGIIVGFNYTEIVNEIADIIASILQEDIKMGANLNTLLTVVFVTTMIELVGNLITAKYAENYFKKVIFNGTPFDEDNSKRLFKLGVLLIVIPLSASLINQVATSVFILKEGISGSFKLSVPSDVILGGLFIFMSYICKYGAETIKEKAAEDIPDEIKDNEIEE